jgi:putative peptidoglycan lipid II flippase
MNKENSAVKTINYIIVITLIGKLMGLYRDRLIAITFGTGMDANAFLTASLIPRVFFDVVFASAITSCFIPIFNEYLTRDGEKRAFFFAHSFITLVICATVAITTLGMVFSGTLVNLFGDGFDAATADLCQKLLIYMFPTVVFTGVAFAFVGILQSLGEFNVPAAISIISNGVIILYFFLFGDDFGVYGLAAAFLVGWLGQALVQLPSLKKYNYIYRPHSFLHEEGIKKVLLLMAPVMVSTWVQPVNISVATRFASYLYEGSGASAIQYANNLYTVLIGVIVLSITNVIFPKMAKLSAGNDNKGFSRVLSVSMRSVIFILIPLAVGTMVLSSDAVNLIYGGGEFDAFSLTITKKALFWLSLGMLGFGIQTVLTRAFFAVQQGKAPLLAGVAAIFVNIISCYFLVKCLDIGGLALASSLAAMVNAAFLWIPLQRKYNALWNKVLCVSYLKMIFAAVFMGGIVFFLHNFIVLEASTSTFLKLGVFLGETFVGVMVYLSVGRMMKLDEAMAVFGFIHKKLGR